MAGTVNGLWIHGELSPMELLTIRSFMAHGFSFHLWTYDTIKNIPDHAILKDANEIVPEKNIFTYRSVNAHGHGKGSYAGFSDIFRFKLLYEKGGIWTDMDVTCLHPFDIDTPYFFRYHHKAGAVGNFMKCPEKSAMMLWCYEQAAAKIDAQNTDWMLPVKILNEGILEYHLEQHIHQISNNDSFPQVAKLLSSSFQTPASWKIIHWMNEEFRRLEIPKDICIPGSLLEQLYHQHQVPYKIYSGAGLLKNRLLVSRYYYLMQNINSTLNWYLSPR